MKNFLHYLLLGMIILTPQGLSSCSGIRLINEDASVVYARTMEFPFDLKSEVIAIPRNTSFTGTLPNKKDGIHWKNKYGIVGVNGFGVNHILDGFNEEGLAVGLYYFTRQAGYQPSTKKDAKHSLAPWELGTFLLSSCKTVQDVRKAIIPIKIAPTYQESIKNIPPIHYVVHDAQGNSIVIEPIEGKLIVHNNPLGVITNSPSFDWHMTNLRNYVHLFSPQTPKVLLKGVELFQTGQGCNFWGLPGDFTPPSRFVRLVALSQTAHSAETADKGISLAINIINNITIPKGSIVEKKENTTLYEYTQWVTICDLTNKRLYYRTYDNHSYRYIDAKKISFKEGPIKKTTLQEPACYKDYTDKLQ